MPSSPGFLCTRRRRSTMSDSIIDTLEYDTSPQGLLAARDAAQVLITNVAHAVALSRRFDELDPIVFLLTGKSNRGVPRGHPKWGEPWSRALAALKRDEWIIHVAGKKGVASHIGPTEKFVREFDRVSAAVKRGMWVPPIDASEPDCDIVVQKASRKLAENDPELRGGEYNPDRYGVAEMRAALLELNRSNRRFEWTIEWPGYSDLGSPIRRTPYTAIDPANIDFRRVFSHDRLDCGGRFYSELTSSLRSAHRLFLTADKEELVEIDFKACHTRLAYAELGMDPPNLDDPYDLGAHGAGIPRTLVKQTMNVLLNWPGEDLSGLHGRLSGYIDDSGKWIDGSWQEGRKKAERLNVVRQALGFEPHDLGRDIPWTELEVEAAVRAIRAAHPMLWGTFMLSRESPSPGVRLQFLESKIAARVAAWAVAACAPLHIVHDSFMTWIHFGSELRAAIRAAYAAETGRELPEKAVSASYRLSDRRPTPPWEPGCGWGCECASCNGVG